MRIPEEPPNLNYLLNKYAPDLPAIIGDARLQEQVRRCEQQYLPWQKLKFLAAAKGIEAEKVWLLAKISRESRFKVLPLHGKDLPLRFTVPDRLQYELMQIDQQLAGGLSSDDDVVPSASQKERFILNSLREEAIASSMLEGAVTTRKEAKQMLRSGRRPRSRGERMVLNNYQAIQFIRENRRAGLSPEFLIELQRILTDKTLDEPDQVGRFRRPEDHIQVVDSRDNEVMHNPPNAKELPNRLKALCEFANRPARQNDFIHPVISACILHFQIGYDHPFCDGNGRTARALFYWMMLRSGYWLFEYLPISRLIYRAPGKYARAFLYCETDAFDVTYFLMYKAQIIQAARDDLQKHIARQQKQVAEARQLFSSDRRLNHRQHQIILDATRNHEKYFTIAEHQQRNNIAYGTARSDFLQLARWKYLKKLVVGNRFEFAAGEKVLGSDLAKLHSSKHN